MASYKTVGIVLRRQDLGEADRIITMFTADRGKVRVSARGVRRSRSKMAGHLELFSEVDIMVAERRTLDVLTSARLVVHHAGIAEDLGGVAYAYLFAEMLGKLTQDEDASAELFDTMRVVLTELAEHRGDVLLELFFKLRLLAGLGYTPQLSACVECGQDDGGNTYFFSAERGGILDGPCRDAGAMAMSQNQIKLWRLCLAVGPRQLRRVQGAADMARDTVGVCDSFYDQVFGKRFRSSGMLLT